MRHSPRTGHRRGFTLVELLVACALTVLIMAVLSTAFQAGMTTFSHLKSTVGLSEQLRSAEAVLRRDLEAPHLQDADGTTVRVSNPGVGNSGWAGASAKGYFEVVQATAPNATSFVLEGSDDSVRSFRATDHALFFTSRLSGASAQDVFTGDVADATVPLTALPLNPNPPFTTYNAQPGQTITDFAAAGGNAVASQWAEIGLFLVPNNTFTTDDTGTSTLPLHSLVRRQRVLAQTAVPVAFDTVPATYTATPVGRRDYLPEGSFGTQILGTSTGPGGKSFVLFNDPGSVIAKKNRLGYVVLGTGPGAVTTAAMPADTAAQPFRSLKVKSGHAKEGTDILIPNVVSMQVRVLTAGGAFIDQLPAAAATKADGITQETVNLTTPAGGFRLDSASPLAAPSQTQMRALQIKLRVYDTKNRMTRQMTFSVDL